MTPDGKDAQQQARDAETAAILNSDDQHRVIVAGPGTGKTFTFKEAFKREHDSGLALTFLKVLKESLRDDLPKSVDVYSFDGYARHLMHRITGNEPRLYGFLPVILAEDITGITGVAVYSSRIEQAYHDMDDSDGVLTVARRLTDYYRAVSIAGCIDQCVRRPTDVLRVAKDYRLLVVDEFQDLTCLEVALFDILATRYRTLVAGDDEQALFGFRPATAEHLVSRVAAFGSFPLTFCSRCPRVVVDAVNDIVRSAKLPGRLPKDYECFMSTTTDSKRLDSELCSSIAVPVVGNQEVQPRRDSRVLRTALPHSSRGWS